MLSFFWFLRPKKYLHFKQKRTTCPLPAYKYRGIPHSYYTLYSQIGCTFCFTVNVFFTNLSNYVRLAIFMTKACCIILCFFSVTQDMHGKTEAGLTPEKDVSQDYELLASSQNGSHTSVVFRRAWDTCDKHDDVLFGVRASCILYYTTYNPLYSVIVLSIAEMQINENKNKVSIWRKNLNLKTIQNICWNLIFWSIQNEWIIENGQ